jgi:hypothetical protein
LTYFVIAEMMVSNQMERRHPMTALALGGVLGVLVSAVWYGLVARP